MSPETIAALDRFTDDIAEGRITIPVNPEGPVLLLDGDGDEITEPPSGVGPAGVDFPEQYPSIPPGTYELTALGTPLTVTIDGDWLVQERARLHGVHTRGVGGLRRASCGRR